MTSHVLAPHDDGLYRVAALLDQFRSRADGSWRVVVRYTTSAGQTYVRAMPAADCRHVGDRSVAVAEPQPAGGRTGVRPDRFPLL
jgi:hypothetical protein